ncbi:hypothetical protein BDZ94DRAFT_1260271 [Collybia nuda]|uniref:Uncharacterized protein n=1 Tax=Collybia nuda TaxID=64659 RepID=A0A9P5Y452_9AGAR|nr:hypothetical protein BDZ94DRAFT_1260271 [Collybia nuda]
MAPRTHADILCIARFCMIQGLEAQFFSKETIRTHVKHHQIRSSYFFFFLKLIQADLTSPSTLL